MSSIQPIFNILSWQEKVLLVLTSMVFVAQPLPFVTAKLAVIVLAVCGLWILLFPDMSFYKKREIGKNAGFRQILLIFLLLGVPGLISLCGTYNIQKTLWFVLLIPVFFCCWNRNVFIVFQSTNCKNPRHHHCSLFDLMDNRCACAGICRDRCTWHF